MSSPSPQSTPDPISRSPWHYKLRPLVFATVGSVTFLLLALSVYSALNSRAHYEQRAELLTQNLAEATDSGVSANIDNIDLALTAVVRHLEDQLAQGGLDLAAERAFVQSETAQRPELQAMRVTDARGLVIVAPATDPKAAVSMADRAWFKTQRDHPETGILMSPPLMGKFNEGWVISFSRRFVAPNGAFAGAVTAAVPVSYFSRLIGKLDVGPHGVVVLRDKDLALIARAPEIPPGPGSQVGDRKVSAELKALVDNKVRSATYLALAPADGVERIDTMHRLRSGSMIVVVGVAPRDFLLPWFTEVGILAALCLAAVFAQVLGAALLLRMGAQNQKARHRIDLLAKVFEQSSEALVITDKDSRIVEVNPAFTTQTGYAAAEVIGRDPDLFASPRTAEADHDAISRAIASSGFWRGEIWRRAKDGHEYATWMSVTAVRDAQGAVEHFIGSSIDMTDLKQAQAKILALAHHDSLTGLPNRVHLQARLEQALASARRDGSELAMLFVDLDRFKNVNDTLGHGAGDALLVEVARRLRNSVRDSDIVARFGGDEFIVVLTGVADAERSGVTMASKLLGELSAPFVIEGQIVHSTPSIGISVFPADGETADQLMKAADSAMYHTKASGRNSYHFFTRAMTEAAAERNTIEAGLRDAIELGELFLNYQPQVDLRSGRVVGLEALIRWKNPGLGLVPPMKFIPIAEDTGQIEAIGAWVLDQALAQVVRWRKVGHASIRVAVNLSTHQLRNNRFPALVAAALRKHGLRGDALELEITESVAMQDPIRTAKMLGELRDLGIKLAIDDFGTGYSSLAYLKQLPLNCLKLDRSFVMDIEHDKSDAAICTATIQLAHSLDLAVVAEGVETLTQLQFLRDLDCDLAQGYYIAKPLASQACTDFLRQGVVSALGFTNTSFERDFLG